MTLSLHEWPDGVETDDGPRIVYDLDRGEAFLGSARVDGPALVWEISGVPGPGEWIVEDEQIVHFGENATDQSVVILASSLLEADEPPAILVSPAPSAT